MSAPVPPGAGGGDLLPGWTWRAEASRRVADVARRAAARATAVLITGESGVGKSHLARCIHALAKGSDGVVRYESAHVDGVDSELVVRSSHSAQGRPETIREIRRILLEHAAELESESRSAGGAG